MNKDQFNFECEDKYSPLELLNKRLKEIDSATKGYVVGKIEKYDGPIDSYIKKNSISAIRNVFNGNEESVDIQNSLGDISETPENRFEVFLAAKVLDKYKYRIMFVEYGELAYPAKIVLNDSIAKRAVDSYTYVLTIKSMNELIELIDKIYSSEYFVSILQNVINESIRRENDCK